MSRTHDRMNLIRAIDVIEDADPGTMIYARFYADDKEWRTGLFVREDLDLIAELGPAPLFELRGGAFERDGVYVMVIMLACMTVDRVYETVLNYHQTGGGAQYVADLMAQTRLPILFFDSMARRRSLEIRNGLRGWARDVQPHLKASRPWSMEEFDRAWAEIQQEYPAIEDLWRVMA